MIKNILKLLKRQVFGVLERSVTTPVNVWNATWEILSEDILYSQRRKKKNPNLNLSEDQIKSLALAEIESLLLINGSSLEVFNGMPRPDAYAYDTDVNTLISDELNYNHDEQREKHRELLAKITDEQKAVYQEILDAVHGDKGGLFFVYGFGGTGKTFLWNILGAAIRSLGEIILNVASSGIASLLLPVHEIKMLTVGAIIMLLRNIDPQGGLCNGTRLQITQLADHVIEARIITGHRNDKEGGERVLIPRMFVSPPETRFPFRMRRRQFPV
ncbi:unnamed protein product, partial [Brassica oleracea var. botrytis]